MKIGFGGFENNGMGTKGGKEERGWSRVKKRLLSLCVRDEKRSNNIGTHVGEWE